MLEISQIQGSIDTIEIAIYCDNLPSDEELIERGFRSKPGRFVGKKNWEFENVSDVYEPRISIYPTWGAGRIRVGASLPKMLYGHNVELLDASGIYKAIDLIGERVKENLGVVIDVLNSHLVRIDYAANIKMAQEHVCSLLKHFRGFSVPYLTRNILGNEAHSVYFQNKSRANVLYDKRGELLAGKEKSEELIRLATGMVRIESRFLNEAKIKQIASKRGFGDHRTFNFVTPEQISSSMDELINQLQLKTLVLESPSSLHTIAQLLDFDLKLASELYGFQASCATFGLDFYKDPRFNYSPTRYKRNVKALKNLGLPLLP